MVQKRSVMGRDRNDSQKRLDFSELRTFRGKLSGGGHRTLGMLLHNLPSSFIYNGLINLVSEKVV